MFSHAVVDSHDEEFDDFNINFLHPSGFSSFYYYPSVKDTCNIDKHDIIKILSSPSLKPGTQRIQYSFLKKELQNIF